MRSSSSLATTTSPVFTPARRPTARPQSPARAASSRKARLHGGGGTHRSERVVLRTTRGAPNAAMHAVARELDDRAAVRLDHGARGFVEPRHHAPHRLRVEPLVETVEPTRSANTIVTVLRPAPVGPAGAPIAAPQASQKRELGLAPSPPQAGSAALARAAAVAEPGARPVRSSAARAVQVSTVDGGACYARCAAHSQRRTLAR